MTWKYCTIRKTRRIKGKTYHSYEIHEVYFDKKNKDKILGWTKEPIIFYGESLKELQGSLARALADSLWWPPMIERKGKLITRKHNN